MNSEKEGQAQSKPFMLAHPPPGHDPETQGTLWDVVLCNTSD